MEVRHTHAPKVCNLVIRIHNAALLSLLYARTHVHCLTHYSRRNVCRHDVPTGRCVASDLVSNQRHRAANVKNKATQDVHLTVGRSGPCGQFDLVFASYTVRPCKTHTFPGRARKTDWLASERDVERKGPLDETHAIYRRITLGTLSRCRVPSVGQLTIVRRHARSTRHARRRRQSPVDRRHGQPACLPGIEFYISPLIRHEKIRHSSRPNKQRKD
jgi:hypothetical protein